MHCSTTNMYENEGTLFFNIQNLQNTEKRNSLIVSCNNKSCCCKIIYWKTDIE